MRGLGSELGRALRGLARRPLPTAVAVGAVAVGVAVQATLFATLEAVVWRPLPYREPERLVAIWASWPGEGLAQVSVSGGDFRFLEREARTLSGVAAVGTIRQTLLGGGEPRQVVVGWVSESFFDVLGTDAALGRGFAAREEPRSLVLGDALWRSALGADPAVVGRPLVLDGTPFTVVGVLPPELVLHLAADAGIATDVDLWRPPDPVALPSRWEVPELESSTLRLIARLADGATLEAARGELAGLARRLRETYPDHARAGFELTVEPLHDEVVGAVRPALLALEGAALLLAAVVVATLAGLAGVRAREEERSTAIRAALGAGRGGLVRPFLAEAIVVGAIGAGLGLLLGRGGLLAVERLAGSQLPRGGDLALAPSAIAIGVVLGLALAVAGSLPALRFRPPSDVATLLRGGARTGAGRGRVRSRRLAVGLQVALATVLLVGSGLLVRSFARLVAVRPGFDPAPLLTFSFSLPGLRYEAPGGVDAFVRRLTAGLEALPGVERAAVGWPFPLEGQIFAGGYQVVDAPTDPDARRLADFRVVSPGWLETVGTRLAEGRDLRDDDTTAVLVDRAMARRLAASGGVLGRRLAVSLADPPLEVSVAGVVEDVRPRELRDAGRETIYFPTASQAWTDWELFAVVRAAAGSDPRALFPAARAVLAGLDPEVPPARVRTGGDLLAAARATDRLALALLGLFAVVAAALAAGSLYGTAAAAVESRVAELALRRALGARRRGLARLVLLEVLGVGAAGLTAGLLAALAASSVLASRLYGVERTDPATYLATAAALLAVVVVAGLRPALRASRVDPATALRQG